MSFSSPSRLARDLDDTELVERLRAGDAEVFQAVVSDLTPGLVRMARRYVSDALAEEVVQETWLSVIGAIDSFQQRSSLKTWVFQIMLNKVRTLAKREAKITPFAAMGRSFDKDHSAVDVDRLNDPIRGPGHWNEPPPAWNVPADEVERKELLEKVAEGLEQLPPAQREVVELRDVQGWSANEVCNVLGISSVNQRVLLHRGRTALRSRLEEYLNNV